MTSSLVDRAIVDLRIAGEDLTRRGWPAQLREDRIGDDRDVRLQVRHAGKLLAVEVLGPYADAVGMSCWQAVRITREDRVVWNGPRRADVRTAHELVPFVEDLLRDDDAALACRYTHC